MYFAFWNPFRLDFVLCELSFMFTIVLWLLYISVIISFIYLYARSGIVTTVYSSTVPFTLRSSYINVSLSSTSSFPLRCRCYCTSLLVRHCLSVNSLFIWFLLRIYVHSLRSTSTDWNWDEQLLLYSQSRRSLFMWTMKWGNVESTNQRSEAVLLNPRSNSLPLFI